MPGVARSPKPIPGVSARTWVTIRRRTGPSSAATRLGIDHLAPDHTIRAHMTSHRLPERDRPWMMRTYAGHSTAKASNELYRKQHRQGPDRASRSRSTCPRRPATTPTTSWRAARSARSASRSRTGRHAHADGRHPAGRDEHVDDDQRHGRVAARALHRRRRGERRRAGARSRARRRTTSSRSSSRGTYAFPPGALDAADRRHDRLHGRATSPSGTRSTSAATTCRRPARRRCRRSLTR